MLMGNRFPTWVDTMLMGDKFPTWVDSTLKQNIFPTCMDRFYAYGRYISHMGKYSMPMKDNIPTCIYPTLLERRHFPIWVDYVLHMWETVYMGRFHAYGKYISHMGRSFIYGR